MKNNKLYLFVIFLSNQLKEDSIDEIGGQKGLGLVGACVVGQWGRDWLMDSEATIEANV